MSTGSRQRAVAQGFVTARGRRRRCPDKRRAGADLPSRLQHRAPRSPPPAGRGVGMDIVRTNVGRLNGEVEVWTGEPGVGTRFSLRLPLTALVEYRGAARAQRPARHPGGAGQRGTGSPPSIRASDASLRGRSRAGADRGDRRLPMVRLDRALKPPEPASARQLAARSNSPRGAAAASCVRRAPGPPARWARKIVVKPPGAFLDGWGPTLGRRWPPTGARCRCSLDPVRLPRELRHAGRRAGWRVVTGGESSRASLRPPLVDQAPGQTGTCPRPHCRPSAGARKARVLRVDDSDQRCASSWRRCWRRRGPRSRIAADGAEAMARLGERDFDAAGGPT